jgi:hypothetical protein
MSLFRRFKIYEYVIFAIVTLAAGCALFNKNKTPTEKETPPEQFGAIPLETTAKDSAAPNSTNSSANNSAAAGTSNFELIKNKKWILSEVRIGYGYVVLDRELMAGNQMSDYYSLQFINEGVNGVAAPNRYYAPYALVESNNVMIHPVASTLMASSLAIGVLDEQKFFSLLQNMKRWSEINSILHIYSTEGEANTTLVFTAVP